MYRVLLNILLVSKNITYSIITENSAPVNTKIGSKRKNDTKKLYTVQNFLLLTFSKYNKTLLTSAFNSGIIILAVRKQTELNIAGWSS